MRRLLVLGLLLLLALAAYVLFRGESGGGRGADVDRRDGPESRRADARALDATEPALQGRPAVGGAEAPEAAKDGQPIVFDGGVFAAIDHRPLEGAEVTVFASMTGSTDARLARVVASARSGSDGGYRIEAALPAVTRTLWLEGRAPGRSVNRVQLTMGRPAYRWDIYLKPAGRIEGRVVRADGGALEDALLWLIAWGGRSSTDLNLNAFPRPARAAADGSFRLENVPFGYHLLVCAKATDGAEGRSLPFRIDAKAPVVRDARVTLARPASVRGRLVHPGGDPWIGGGLELRRLGPRAVRREPWFERVERGGSFAFGGVPAGDYELRFVHLHLGDPVTLVEPLRVEDAVDLGDVVVGTGRTVSGRIVVRDGRPEDASRVSLQLWSGSDYRETSSEDDGTFRFPSVGPGTWRLVVESESWRIRSPVFVEAGASGLVVDVIGPSAAILLTASDAQGDAVPDEPQLTILEHGMAGPHYFRWISGSSGIVRSEGMPAGTYDLRLEAEGYALWTRDRVVLVPGEVKRMAVRLEPAPRLERRVVSAAGRPVADAEVILSYRNAYPLGPASPRMGDVFLDDTVTGAGGWFDIGVPRPDLLITVKAEGHASLRVPVRDLPAGDDIVLPRGWDLVGRLVDEDGSGVGHVSVLLEPRERLSNVARATFTEPDGTFRFPHTASGSLWITVRSHAGVAVFCVPVEVADGPTDVGAIRLMTR